MNDADGRNDLPAATAGASTTGGAEIPHVSTQWFAVSINFREVPPGPATGGQAPVRRHTRGSDQDLTVSGH